jgi:thioredoxin reductase (NADPH)
MSVKLATSIKSFNANDAGKLSSITLSCDGAEETHETAGAFVFIGLDPNTSFLDNDVDVDERGFIVTDQMFRTSVDGIFAAGDVRSGSTKQIASAVGEGAAVALQIRYYLDALNERVNA